MKILVRLNESEHEKYLRIHRQPNFLARDFWVLIVELCSMGNHMNLF